MEKRVQELIHKHKGDKLIPSSETKIVGLDWSGADLAGWDFSNCILSTNNNKANFGPLKWKNKSGEKKEKKTNLNGANFSYARLGGADFSKAILNRAIFQKAKLSGSIFEGASLSSYQS